MRFRLSIEYGLRLLGFLYQNEGVQKAADMAKAAGVTYLYSMKVVQALRAKKLVVSIQGCNGGYMLGRPAEQITVYDVMNAVDGELDILPVMKEEIQPVLAEPTNSFYLMVQDAIDEIVRNTTIADLYGVGAHVKKCGLKELREKPNPWEIREEKQRISL